MTTKAFVLHRVVPAVLASVVLLAVVFDLFRHSPRSMETLYPGLEQVSSIDYSDLSILTTSGQGPQCLVYQPEEVERLWKAVTDSEIKYDGYSNGAYVDPSIYTVGFAWKAADGTIAHESVLMDGHGYVYEANGQKFRILHGEEELFQVMDFFLGREAGPSVSSD